jgi:hypothetical protein
VLFARYLQKRLPFDKESAAFFCVIVFFKFRRNILGLNGVFSRLRSLYEFGKRLKLYVVCRILIIEKYQFSNMKRFRTSSPILLFLIFLASILQSCGFVYSAFTFASNHDGKTLGANNMEIAATIGNMPVIALNTPTNYIIYNARSGQKPNPDNSTTYGEVGGVMTLRYGVMDRLDIATEALFSFNGSVGGKLLGKYRFTDDKSLIIGSILVAASTVQGNVVIQNEIGGGVPAFVFLDPLPMPNPIVPKLPYSILQDSLTLIGSANTIELGIPISFDIGNSSSLYVSANVVYTRFNVLMNYTNDWC